MVYRVELPVFCGPLDLLLHLVKQQEVDVHEVRIATILDQYLAHLELLRALDLADLGDFLVLASTLMEIKSREMLPREDVDIDDELDPRDDLIRRLLEYKRFRDISRRLDRYMQRRERMLDVTLPLPEAVVDEQRTQQAQEEEELLDLGDVEIWTLTAAFARLLQETGQQSADMAIGVDKRNMRHYAARLLERIKDGAQHDFVGLFDRDEGRYGLIGTFVALLEMMKQGVLRALQGEAHGDIRVQFIGDPAFDVDQLLGNELLADDGDAGDGDEGDDDAADGGTVGATAADQAGDDAAPE